MKKRKKCSVKERKGVFLRGHYYFDPLEVLSADIDFSKLGLRYPVKKSKKGVRVPCYGLFCKLVYVDDDNNLSVETNKLITTSFDSYYLHKYAKILNDADMLKTFLFGLNRMVEFYFVKRITKSL